MAGGGAPCFGETLVRVLGCGLRENTESVIEGPVGFIGVGGCATLWCLTVAQRTSASTGWRARSGQWHALWLRSAVE
jgi:hypothetical protein